MLYNRNKKYCVVPTAQICYIEPLLIGENCMHCDESVVSLRRIISLNGGKPY